MRQSKSVQAEGVVTRRTGFFSETPKTKRLYPGGASTLRAGLLRDDWLWTATAPALGTSDALVDRLEQARLAIGAHLVAGSLDLPLGQSCASGSIELFYDTIADNFDRLMNPYDLERRVETVFDVLLKDYDLRGCTLLDAGCGTGWFSLRACDRGANVTALDIGPKLLSQVRRKCHATTVQGDVLDLQFADGAFDVVLSSECIEHTRDPRQAVRELIRVCRPGGLVVLTCPNRFWYWLCVVANRLHLRPYEGLEDWPRWSDLPDWFEAENVQVIEHRGIHLLPFQVSLLHPMLKFLDRFGRFHGRFCVNQALLAVKSR